VLAAERDAAPLPPDTSADEAAVLRRLSLRLPAFEDSTDDAARLREDLEREALSLLATAAACPPKTLALFAKHARRAINRCLRDGAVPTLLPFDAAASLRNACAYLRAHPDCFGRQWKDSDGWSAKLAHELASRPRDLPPVALPPRQLVQPVRLPAALRHVAAGAAGQPTPPLPTSRDSQAGGPVELPSAGSKALRWQRSCAAWALELAVRRAAAEHGFGAALSRMPAGAPGVPSARGLLEALYSGLRWRGGQHGVMHRKLRPLLLRAAAAATRGGRSIVAAALRQLALGPQPLALNADGLETVVEAVEAAFADAAAAAFPGLTLRYARSLGEARTALKELSAVESGARQPLVIVRVGCGRYGCLWARKARPELRRRRAARPLPGGRVRQSRAGRQRTAAPSGNSLPSRPVAPPCGG